jgi:pimeloyl-ACP methyl ester carboxylesterase
VDELRALLAKAELPPPYVLVGWSFGGSTVHAFAQLHPGEVAGAVFVDSVAPIGCRAGLRTLEGEPADCAISGSELPAVGPVFGAKPIAVLENALDTDAQWQDRQRMLAALSSNSLHVRADRSDHFGFLYGQADLTAAAVREIVTAVRTKIPLSGCTAIFQPLSGTCLS